MTDTSNVHRSANAADERANTEPAAEVTVAKTRAKQLAKEREDAIVETKQALRRIRRRRTKLQQPAFDPKAPKKPVKHHDVLVVAPQGVHLENELFRIPVVKVDDQANQGEIPETPARVGEYVDLPEKLDSYDYSARRAMSIARPHDWGAHGLRKEQRGPAFGTLPVKSEPAATACMACYLIDEQNLSFRNAWTAEEWNDFLPESLDAAPSADNENFEVLLAGPRGMVFHVKLELADNDQPLWQPGESAKVDAGGTTKGSVRCLNMRHEMEIWNQLRNGCVAGRAISYTSGDSTVIPNGAPTSLKPLPLVNVTSLILDADDPAKQSQLRLRAVGTEKPNKSSSKRKKGAA